MEETRSQRTISPRSKGEASLPVSLLTWIWILSGIFMGAVLCLTVGVLAALCGDKQRRIAHRLLAFGYNTATRTYPLYKVTVTGRENMPSGSCVICPNHQSLSDVVYLYRLDMQFKWVIKHQLFWLPPFGQAMWVAGYPSIRRGNADSAQALMNRVGAYLREGMPVLNFPEGKRSATGQLGRFQTGAARMAIASGVPLVPVAIEGTGRLMPKGSLLYPATGHVRIHIGKPLSVEHLKPKDARRLTRALRSAVMGARKVIEDRTLPPGKSM